MKHRSKPLNYKKPFLAYLNNKTRYKLLHKFSLPYTVLKTNFANLVKDKLSAYYMKLV